MTVARVTLKPEVLFAEHPVLQTERLILRKMAPEDAPGHFAYCSDMEVVQHVPLEFTPDLAAAERSIRGFMSMYEAKRAAPWGINLKSTGEHIGLIGFESWNPQVDRAEIGFVIAKSVWRQGIATEAALRVLRFGFEVMRLHRLEGRVTPANEGSKQLLVQKLGMQREGLLRGQSYWRGAYHDLDLYSVLRPEAEALGLLRARPGDA